MADLLQLLRDSVPEAIGGLTVAALIAIFSLFHNRWKKNCFRDTTTPDDEMEKLVIRAQSQQQKAVSAFGIIMIGLMIAIAVFFPYPTPFRYLVFRVILALAAAGVAAMIPGTIKANVGPAVEAGGAIAVFIVVFFFSPADLVVNPQLPTFPPSPEAEKIPPPSSTQPRQGVNTAADTFDGVDCSWNNSLVDMSNERNHKIIWTGGQHGGDGGFRIPDRYKGKRVEVEFMYEVLEGRAQVGIDRYAVGMLAAAQIREAPWRGKQSVVDDIPDDGSGIAIVRLGRNSRVRIEWGSIKTK